jgi:hypothetical protein
MASPIKTNIGSNIPLSDEEDIHAILNMASPIKTILNNISDHQDCNVRSDLFDMIPVCQPVDD